ncbi:MAG TPA: histidinol dehydrogenase [Rhodothermales bacterium]|nr:histidinol dehydrogenase [Rhodothermales bacterium]
MIAIVDYNERHERLGRILSRSASFSPEVDDAVRTILDDVCERGDAALAEYTQRFDGVRPGAWKVPAHCLEAAYREMDEELRAIIREAAHNVRRFHERQRRNSWFTDEEDGVVLGQRIVPIERVGLYVPGGKAFYPSSLLMNAIPAQVAGVPQIHVASPPGKSGLPHPLVLGTAHLLGLEHLYAVGGAQAIGALAYGTESIPKVDKIAGPGNAYVAAAKKQVYGTVDIDAVAGPSEIVVLADHTADPEFIAADMLSQAEHDERASAILVTPDRNLARTVRDHIERLVPTLPRRAILERSLTDYGACIVTDTLEEAVAMVNELAPEHLEIVTEDPWDVMTRIRHAGAVFLGPYSSEPVGDYFAGPNHVLPTGGTARYASALSVDDFVRKQSVIAYTRGRLRDTGPRIARFAEAEDLQAHALAIQVRLDRMKSGDDR